MIPVAWLTERVTETDPRDAARRDLCHAGIAPAAQEQMLGSEGFVAWRQRWVSFLAQMVPGDELWYFTSPPGQWQALSGASGYAIVRGGAPVEILCARRG